MATQDLGLSDARYGRGFRLRTLAARALRAALRWDARYRERAHLATLDREALEDMGISPDDPAVTAPRPF
ncbi:DUF1127 domain-containing protein [Amaricoccus sp.]|uniref:DUF1127 domain-containing protein n=1 Tax=Amaricoccus sp. TaxID=1872485 RepID=UPI001B760EE6|nr:DUF1127 domain-containing protein [Amaricoccus sp.]MBP7000793.1 DUF1127 domain-containing protein [Amaricoccus sp.]